MTTTTTTTTTTKMMTFQAYVIQKPHVDYAPYVCGERRFNVYVCMCMCMVRAPQIWFPAPKQAQNCVFGASRRSEPKNLTF